MHQTTGHPAITLPNSTTVQVGALGPGQRSSSSAYVTSLAVASAAERDRQVKYSDIFRKGYVFYVFHIISTIFYKFRKIIAFCTLST